MKLKKKITVKIKGLKKRSMSTQVNFLNMRFEMTFKKIKLNSQTINIDDEIKKKNQF